jgi:phospholipid N-methyltransferase
MPDRDFFAKSNEIFTSLFNLANEELSSKGINVEPSVIVDRIISPLKDLYLKNSIKLLESLLEKIPDMPKCQPRF